MLTVKDKTVLRSGGTIVSQSRLPRPDKAEFPLVLMTRSPILNSASVLAG